MNGQTFSTLTVLTLSPHVINTIRNPTTVCGIQSRFTFESRCTRYGGPADSKGNMLSPHLNSMNIHATAVTTLTIANVWLFVQNFRWLMYSHPVSTLVPGTDQYRSIDPLLEIPGIVVGLIAGYVLLNRYAVGIWRIRYSVFHHALATRVQTINSVLLVVLTAVGVFQWTIWFNTLAIDVIVVGVLGATSAIAAIVLERRIVTHGDYSLNSIMPMYTLKSLASVWRKSSMT